MSKTARLSTLKRTALKCVSTLSTLNIFKFLILFFIFLNFTNFTSPAFALSNSADAFMSLPFGHTFKRTQLRMERSGAKVVTPRPDSLLMTGYFEGYQTEFTFTFYKKKLLKSKAAYLKSTGSQSRDKNFYELLKKGFERQYGSGKEMPVENSLVKGRIMMKNTWTPDRYTTITLIYNSEATKRFPGNSVKDRPIHIIYYYNKWDKN